MILQTVKIVDDLIEKHIVIAVKEQILDSKKNQITIFNDALPEDWGFEALRCNTIAFLAD